MSSQSVVFAPAAPKASDIAASQRPVTDWLQLIRSEYLEIPGLRLTRNQARRLWALDDLTCDALLDALLDMKFLRRTSTGAYVRADG